MLGSKSTILASVVDIAMIELVHLVYIFHGVCPDVPLSLMESDDPCSYG
jgi:hypothetical protein